uniref:Reverse transcriptase domain-containing protein n=1 Tax=Tanacetum cinerariifolium TaxID=118510 RepID=A0A6L2LCI0_TANCI|nr:reverse transcriptase domain-containing protein [Tanacetum cinerariifolium]
MSTRSSARNLYPPLDNPKLTIQRRSRTDPTLLNDSEIAAEGNGDLPVPDLRTMEELCQPSLNALKAEMSEINKNLMRVLQVNQQLKAVTSSCETCGGPHSFFDIPAIIGNTQNVYAAGAYQVVTTNEFTNFMKANDAILKNMQTNMNSLTNSNLKLKNMFDQFIKINTASSSGSRTLPCNTITNPKENLKGITTRSGTAYQGPMIPTTSSSLPPVVERETEATKDMVHPTNNRSTEDVQPPVVLTESPILNSQPVISLIIEPVASPKFLEKLGDLGKFLILCDFLRMVECLALVDLGTSINLMPLSLWNKISLPNLSPTCMTQELADRSISPPVGVVEDVFVKVGTFLFPADFVVVDFDADPRVPLIIGRSFL